MPRHKNWTPEEDSLLREHWGEEHPQWIAIQIQRTESAVRRRAWSLIQQGRSLHDPEWSAKEDRELLWYWSEKGPAFLARKLGRTRRAVETRALALLGSLCRRGMFSQKAAAKRLGYSPEQVRGAVEALGLQTRAEGPHGMWRLDEDQLDKISVHLERGRGLTIKEVGEHLGVTRNTVAAWAVELGVISCLDRGVWFRKRDLPRFEARNDQRSNRWTLRHPCCVSCGRTDRRHKGKGKCTLCYTRDRRILAIKRENGQK